MAFYNTTLSQSLGDRYYKYSEIREIYRNQTNRIIGIGDNTFRGLGAPTTAQYTIESPLLINGNWLRSSVAYPNGSAIRYDGTLWCWGSNSGGEVGDNTTTSRSTPVQIGTRKDWAIVKAGNPFWSSFGNAAAIRSDGALFTWGYNSEGQSGQNDIVHRSSPVQVGTNSWIQVATGTATLAIRSDGTLWSWGYNTNGSLGLNDTVHRSSPTQIGTSSWSIVDINGFSAAAIRSDGALFTWGLNERGQLGQNSLVHRSSPVQITASDGTTSFTQVVVGKSHMLAISSAGKVYAWGYNYYGQCGLGVANVSVLIPSPVTIAGTCVGIGVGAFGSTVLRADGSAWWFGQDPGQYSGIGDGLKNLRSSPVQLGTFRYRSIAQGQDVLQLIRE